MPVTTAPPRPRPRLSRMMLTTAAACALVATMAVATAAAAPNVPAATSPVSWSSRVCQALNSFQTDIRKLDQGFTKASQQSLSLASIKAKYVAFLRANASRTARVITGLKAAGVPAAPNGAQFASALQAGYVDLHAGFVSLFGDSRALPTDTLAHFQTAFAAVQAKIQAVETRNQATFDNANQFQSKTINDAFSKVSACKKLNGGA